MQSPPSLSSPVESNKQDSSAVVEALRTSILITLCMLPTALFPNQAHPSPKNELFLLPHKLLQHHPHPQKDFWANSSPTRSLNLLPQICYRHLHKSQKWNRKAASTSSTPAPGLWPSTSHVKNCFTHSSLPYKLARNLCSLSPSRPSLQPLLWASGSTSPPVAA